MTGDNFLSEMLSKNSRVWVCGIKKLTTMYKTFDNYYNHKKYTEYIPLSIVMFLISNFMLFDNITLNNCVFKNIPDIILFCYCWIYFNINSWLGRSMTKFLLLLRFISITLTFILPYYKVISLINYMLNVLFLTVGYHKLTDKSYKQLVELKYHNLYLAPFYAYNFYEKNYNLEENMNKVLNIIINFIKKFPTSDIIKQYNSCNQNTKANNEQTCNEKISEIVDESISKEIKEAVEEMKIDNDNQEENIASDVTDKQEFNKEVNKSITRYEGVQTRSKVNKKED